MPEKKWRKGLLLHVWTLASSSSCWACAGMGPTQHNLAKSLKTQLVVEPLSRMGEIGLRSRLHWVLCLQKQRKNKNSPEDLKAYNTQMSKQFKVTLRNKNQSHQEKVANLQGKKTYKNPKMNQSLEIKDFSLLVLCSRSRWKHLMERWNFYTEK